MSATSWARLGNCPPQSLNDARLACHHALQLLTHAARAYLPPRDDDSHTAVTWNHALAAFTGAPIDAAGPPLTLALRPHDLTLLLLHDGASVAARLALDGLTAPQAGAWLQAHLAAHGLNPEPFRSPLHFEIPPRDGPFRLAGALPYAELARYFANAALVLHAMADGAPVRCWPHHFDIALLLPAPQPGHTLGIGLSPGDASYAQPYFYLSPWPYPDPARLPELPAPAHWHTAGWTGAVLLAEHLVPLDAAESQHRLVASLLRDTAAALLARP